MADFGTIQKYSDDELSNELKKRGIDGVVNGNTRSIMEKKLASRLGISPEGSLRINIHKEEEKNQDDTFDEDQLWADSIRRRVRQSIDMSGKAFNVEEMHARPSEILRARRASEASFMADELAKLQKMHSPVATTGPNTGLVILAVLLAIGVFSMVIYISRQAKV